MHWNKRHLLIFRVVAFESEIICISGVAMDRFLKVSGGVLHAIRRCPEGTGVPVNYKRQRDEGLKRGLPDTFMLKVIQQWIEAKIASSCPTTFYGNDKLQLAMFWSVEEYFLFREYLTPDLYDLYIERTTILSSLFYTRQDADIFLRSKCRNLKQTLTNFSTYLELPRQGYDPLYECSLMRDVYLELLLLDLGGEK
jgi:hypothetical protein